MLRSAVVPRRISGSGETGANHMTSKPEHMVRGSFLVCLNFS